MRWIKLAGFWACTFVLTATVAAAAGPSGRWLHVVVDEGREGGDKVNVQLPLSVVESVLPMVEDEHLRNGKVRVGDSDVKVPDLQQAWKELRNAPDGNFLTVQGTGDKVRVGKAKGLFVVNVDEGQTDGAKVEIKLPLAAVDALFSGEPGELDVLAALRALGEADTDDIVRVTDGSDHVRIWVDSRQAE